MVFKNSVLYIIRLCKAGYSATKVRAGSDLFTYNTVEPIWGITWKPHLPHAKCETVISYFFNWICGDRQGMVKQTAWRDRFTAVASVSGDTNEKGNMIRAESHMTSLLATTDKLYALVSSVVKFPAFPEKVRKQNYFWKMHFIVLIMFCTYYQVKESRKLCK